MSDTTKESDDPVALGERLALLRALAGFKSQTKLAKEVDLAVGTINRLELGKHRVGRPTLDRIIRVLKRRITFDEAWLVYGRGEAPGQSGHAVVEAYIASPLAVGLSGDVAARLRRVSWDTLGVPNPSEKEVHRTRELIEMNLALR